MTMKWCMALVLGATAAVAGYASGVRAQSMQPGVTPDAVRMARSEVIDLPSRINGRTYRVMVSLPAAMQPGTRYPVLYVLDGNYYFGTAAEALTRQAHFRDVLPAIVVGIGYPTDDYLELTRLRAIDFTPSPSRMPQVQGEFGGAQAFARVLEEEIRPLINTRFPVDYARQILWGQSYAGLFVLQTLFLRPQAYSHFALSSPSIWWNDKEILSLEQEFLRKLQSGTLKPAVLVTSAGDEQYMGTDPARLQAQRIRMVDDASELAQRLVLGSNGQVSVRRVIFDGEIHNTVPPASLSRTLRFALPRAAASAAR